MREQLLYYAVKYEGDYTKITKALIHKEEWRHITYEGKYITIIDDEYPACFLQLRYKPWVIFYEGNIRLLHQECIGVVGSRKRSEYGIVCVETLMKHLRDCYGIVSGMAKGIDAYAHQEAIKTNRFTIGVIGCGINVIYPKENEQLYETVRKKHLLISEYPFDVKPLAHHFPWRNRLIAALSKSLVVIEAKRRSGTLITVNEALELSKNIYCFPHRFCDEQGKGCNMLIEQGSGMLNKIEDIKEI